MKRGLVVLIVALPALFASSAVASVTVGQLAPLGTDHTDCSTDRDRLIPVTTSGNSYAVPGRGTLSFWSTNAEPGTGGMLGLKVFRRISEDLFMIVGHDGPRPLVPDSTNTFPVNIPVAPGDIVGLITGPGSASCEFEGGNDEWADVSGPYSDGQTGLFSNGGGGLFYALNISAVFEPTNTFSLGAITRNKKKGTATMAVNDIPNFGDLTGSGKGVKASSAGQAVTSKSVGVGPAQLLIKAKGKKKKKLNQKGKVKLNVAITYTPTSGSPRTQSVKVKLKKNV